MVCLVLALHNVAHCPRLPRSSRPAQPVRAAAACWPHEPAARCERARFLRAAARPPAPVAKPGGANSDCSIPKSGLARDIGLRAALARPARFLVCLIAEGAKG